MLSTDTASEARQPPQRCLSRQAGIVRCCLKKKQQVGQVLPAAFLVCGRHTTHVVQKAKTAAVLQTTADSGGKKGIRTLEGFRGPTRFPVVRLRPAQPSFHIFSCAAPDCKSYYSNRSTKCQAQFCIFLQKNLGWARCTQNVRVKRINLHVLSYCKLLHKVLKLYTNMKLCPKGEDISCIPFFAIWRLLF